MKLCGVKEDHRKIGVTEMWKSEMITAFCQKLSSEEITPEIWT